MCGSNITESSELYNDDFYSRPASAYWLYLLHEGPPDHYVKKYALNMNKMAISKLVSIDPQKGGRRSLGQEPRRDAPHAELPGGRKATDGYLQQALCTPQQFPRFRGLGFRV